MLSAMAAVRHRDACTNTRPRARQTTIAVLIPQPRQGGTGPPPAQGVRARGQAPIDAGIPRDGDHHEQRGEAHVKEATASSWGVSHLCGTARVSATFRLIRNRNML